MGSIRSTCRKSATGCASRPAMASCATCSIAPSPRTQRPRSPRFLLKNAPRRRLPSSSTPGGRDVLDALGGALPGYSLAASRAVLQAHGNMSSPSVLFVLEEHLRHPPTAPGDLWLASFGAGFSAHACRLTAG